MMEALPGISETNISPPYQVAQKISSKVYSLVIYVRDTFFNLCKAISGHGIAAYLIIKGVEKPDLDKLTNIISYVHPRMQLLLSWDVYDKLNNGPSEINTKGLVIDSTNLKLFSVIFPFIINDIKANYTNSTDAAPDAITSRGLLNILHSELEVNQKLFFVNALTMNRPALVCDWNGLRGDELETLIVLLKSFDGTRKLIDDLLNTYEECSDARIKEVISKIRNPFSNKKLPLAFVPPKSSEKDPQKWVEWLEYGSYINDHLLDCNSQIIGMVLSCLSEKKIKAIEFQEPLLSHLPPVAIAIGFYRKLKCDFSREFIEEVICPTLAKYTKEDAEKQKSGGKEGQSPTNSELIFAQCLEAANEDFIKLWVLRHFGYEKSYKEWFLNYFKTYCSEKNEGAALDFKLIFGAQNDPRQLNQLYNMLARVTKDKDLPLEDLLEWTDVEYMIALENFLDKLNDRLEKLLNELDKDIEAKKKGFKEIWENSELSKVYHLFLLLNHKNDLGQVQKKRVTSFLKLIQRNYEIPQALLEDTKAESRI